MTRKEPNMTKFKALRFVLWQRLLYFCDLPHKNSLALVFFATTKWHILKTAYNNSVHFAFEFHKPKVTKTHKNSHQYHTEKAFINKHKGKSATKFYTDFYDIKADKCKLDEKECKTY